MEDKMFGLMTKMYIDMQGIKADIKGIGNRLFKVEIKQEDTNTKLDTIMENQDNLIETNEKSHKEMFEILSGKMGITENVVGILLL